MRRSALSRRSLVSVIGKRCRGLALIGAWTAGLIALGGPATSTASTVTAPQRPASGAYLGMYSELPGLTAAQSITTREQQLGRKLRIDSHYYNWTDTFPTTAETNDTTAGRIPMITWWGTTLSAITNGSNDTLIKTRATALKKYGKPVFLRWGAEMNGNWFAWSGPTNNNNPATYIAAWRHIHDIFTTTGVTNVAWVWAPNANSKPGGTDPTSWNNWRHYYPGDTYVDWVGIDGYNWGSIYSWQTPQTIFGPIYTDYANHKPIMIAETSSVETGGNKANWTGSLQSWFTGHPAAAALIWFDTNTSSTGIDWRIDSSPTAMSAFTTLARSSYFAH